MRFSLLLVSLLARIATCRSVQCIAGSECPQIWFESPSQGEFFKCGLRASCAFDASLRIGAPSIQISVTFGDQEPVPLNQTLISDVDRFATDVSFPTNFNGPLSLSCEIVDEDGVEIASTFVEILVHKNESCSHVVHSLPNNFESLEEVLTVGPVNPPIANSTVECHDNSMTRWCDLRGATYRNSKFYVDAKEIGDVEVPLDSWKPQYKLKCCTQFDPEISLALQFDSPTRREGGCDAVVRAPAIFLSLVNAEHYGHVLIDSFYALYGNVVEMHNGTFSSDVVIITNAGYPLSQSFNQFFKWIHVLSRYPILSISHLHSLGQVCFDRVRVGLSNFFNVHDPTSPGLRHLPDAVSLIRQALQVPRAEMVRGRLAFIERTSEKRSFNIDELEKVAREEGFDVERVTFEGMSLAQQAAVISNCSVLVGVLGSGLFNAMYLPHGSVGIMISPFGIRFPPTRGGMEFEHSIKSVATFLEISIGELSLGDSRQSVPPLAISDPNLFWEQDWYAAFDLYYSRQLRLNVDKKIFREKLGQAKEIVFK